MVEDAIHLLLVEDNPADVALLIELLQDSEAHCWQITSVGRLRPALSQLQETRFDAVLLDLSLPDSRGVDTVTQLHAAVPHVPIVVLTGLHDKTIALQAMAEGAQDYLVKGEISSELLIRTVEYAIERMQILKKLQESEYRFREVFDQTFQCMGLLNLDGVLLDINQSIWATFGFPVESIKNTPIWDALYWRSFAASQAWLRTAVARAAQGEVVQGEIQASTVRNQVVWLDFSIKPVKDDKGAISLLIAEGRDITEVKRAEAEIQQALETERELNQMKNSFISMVSHEFRNPIATIRFAAEVLEDVDLPPERKKKYFEHLQLSIDQLLELLDEVLLLGRTESGRVELEPTLINLEKFCSDLVETFQVTGNSSHQILFSCQGDFSEAEMDAGLLRHILVNLLSNAIKYSPEGSLVQFTLLCQKDQAIFRIQDQGIGIPKADQEKLFQTFHRARNVGKVQGTGLGLAIVKRCVDLQNGQIQVESEEGVGTTFTVILPHLPKSSS